MAVLSTGRVAEAVVFLLTFGSANAFWRLECGGSVGLARIDPLMDFGSVSDHVHTIKGGSGKLLVPGHHTQRCLGDSFTNTSGPGRLIDW